VVKLSKVSNIGWQRGQKSADFVFEFGRTFPAMNDVGASPRFVLGKTTEFVVEAPWDCFGETECHVDRMSHS
jgi:hypothetical protein